MKKIFSVLLVLLMIIISAYFFGKFGHDRYPYYGDGLGYYMYLPSAFIYHNLGDQGDIPDSADVGPSVMGYVTNKDSSLLTPNGHFILQYTYGVALFEAPFFFIAHAISKATGGLSNGYSQVYNDWLKIGYLVYAFIGLWILYRVLRRYVKSYHAIAALFFMYLGSNLFWFDTIQFGMSHPILFMLYGFIIWFTMRLYETKEDKYFYILALVLGLMVLIRPTEIIAFFVPILYGIRRRRELPERWNFFLQKIKPILISAPIFIIPFIPQFFYWKAYTGSWIYYSYGSQTFHWLRPHLFDGIFGFRNGWLPYSTVMIAVLIFFYLFRKKNNKLYLLSVIILGLHIYITYSWECFNYINGYGSRPMIHIYPLLAIPFGMGIEYLDQRGSRVLRSLVVSMLLVGAAHNLSMMWQQSKNILFTDESCVAYYFTTMFKKKIEYKDLNTFDTKLAQPSDNSLSHTRNYKLQDFESSDSTNVLFEDRAGKVCKIDQGVEFTPAYFKDTVIEDMPVDYIRIQGDFYLTDYGNGPYHQPILVFRHVRNGREVWYGTSLHNKICMDGKCNETGPVTFWNVFPLRWGTIHFYASIRGRHLLKDDIIEYGVWNLSLKELYVDNLRLDFFDRK